MAEELQAHLDTIRRWIHSHGVLPKAEPGLTSEERKQLLAVNQSIQQLERLGVSIPDDLRELKLRLTAKDRAERVDLTLKALLDDADNLVGELGELQKEARGLRDRVKDHLPKSGTKTHFGVELAELIAAGLISTEDRLELQWLKSGPVIEGRLRSDGTVMAKTRDGWKQFYTLSAAGTAIAERSLNGWEHWRRVNQNGTRTKLREIRDRFLRENA